MSDDDDQITFRRKRANARAQARSVAKRKALAAPRRDDLTRAADYVLLGLCQDPKIDQTLRASLQRHVMPLCGRLSSTCSRPT